MAAPKPDLSPCDVKPDVEAAELSEDASDDETSTNENTTNQPLVVDTSVDKAPRVDAPRDNKRQRANYAVNPATARRMQPRPPLRLLYNDDRVRDHFFANAQRLLAAVKKDPEAKTKSALIAHKALRYRNLIARLEEIDPLDPAFDICSFFGVEWRKYVKAAEYP